MNKNLCRLLLPAAGWICLSIGLPSGWAAVQEPSGPTGAATGGPVQDPLPGQPPAEGGQTPAAQDPLAQVPATGAPDEEPAVVTKWRSLTRRTRELQEQVSGTLTGISLTDVEQQNSQLQQLDRLKAQLNELKVETYSTAAEALAESKSSQGSFLMSRDALSYMRILMGEDPEVAVFNPTRAGELGGRIVAAGRSSPQITQMTMRAYIASQDFAAARELADQSAGDGNPVSPQITELLGTFESGWARELEMRKRDENANLPMVRIETDQGIIIAELFEDDAPNTVANFVSLVKKGFYKDQAFFGIQPGFMALTGCPEGTGFGHPGYTLPSEAGLESARGHFAGSLSMFHMPGEAAGSRFGFCYQVQPDREGQFTVFGRIIEGLDVLYSMPSYSPSDAMSQRKPVQLRSISMIRERDHEYTPQQTTPVEATAGSGAGMTTPAASPETSPGQPANSGTPSGGGMPEPAGTAPDGNAAFPAPEPQPGASGSAIPNRGGGGF